MSWGCRQAACIVRTPTRRRLSVRQARLRGGWSGGGRLSPSAKISSRSVCVVRTAWRTGRAAVSGGPACAVVITHIATTGQSVQALWLASSGQQGMSPGIADMSVIPPAASACMAAGAATGATASPATMAIASNRVMRRRKTMPYSATATGSLGRGATSLPRQAAMRINRTGCALSIDRAVHCSGGRATEAGLVKAHPRHRPWPPPGPSPARPYRSFFGASWPS